MGVKEQAIHGDFLFKNPGVPQRAKHREVERAKGRGGSALPPRHLF